ncbi:apolipoprotein N-acyltransferase [Halobacteriovorax sp. JY17]|uniref:apolipoprotein N-acyltransferase n=1 Tax=Halobacteriovorax sp. JY17 TaxID=2014617 RepID=UPI000C382334|nr:apolipoprotein N-acyltransferase [Halobacteriovorax sp. JY17]PIK14961.1 MAG: apolipoprotein N-acyltransferase [Halobacteriovorax sp. JY17]
MSSPFSSKWTVTIFIPLIGGIIYATAFPMTFAPSFPLGTIIGMSLLLYSLAFTKKEMMERSIWLDILSVLSFSIGYNTLGYYWIPETLKVFGEIPFPINWMLGVFFSLIICPHLILFTLGHRLYKKFSVKSSSLVSSISSRHIIYAIALTLVERFTPQQFPAHMGHSWLSFAPYLGLAPLFGAPLFSFINFWLALTIAHRLKYARLDKLAIFSSLIFLIANFALPLKKTDETDSVSHNLRLVQANIGNFVKVNSESGKPFAFDEVYERYLRLSTVTSTEPIDLIIWPETAYPRLLNSMKMENDARYTPKLIKEVARITNAEVFTGGYDKSSSENSDYFQTEYNTAFHFGIDGTLKKRFHKMKLIPFGEGLPFGPFNQYLSQYLQNISFFASGDHYTLFKTNKGTPFSAAICYEILFSSFIKDNLNSLDTQPDFLINLTNDSWYGETAEPEQHLFLSKWRALEFDIPIVRMTNTGITSIIYQDGSETERSPLFKEVIQDVKLKTKERGKTLYQEYGLFPTLFIVMTLIIISLILNRRTRNLD